jgi:hypothetical protein
MQSHNSGFMNEQQKFRAKHTIINHLDAELNPICHLLALLGDHHILYVSRIRVKADWAQHIGSDSQRNLKIQDIQKRFGLHKGTQTNKQTYIHTYPLTQQNEEFISVSSFLAHRLIKCYGLLDVTPCSLFIGTNFSHETAASVFSSFHFEE